MNASAPQQFMDWLQQAVDRINEFEARGRAAAVGGEQAAYSAAMRAKAELLADLEDEARPYLEKIADETALSYARSGLAAFSRSAGQALDLDSVFYMSALLFPEDHQPGRPHDLELFRDEAARLLGI